MDDKGYVEVNGQKIKIPDIASGQKIPCGVEHYIERKEGAKRAERKDRLYAILGIVASFVCTIIGWLLGKFC